MDTVQVVKSPRGRTLASVGQAYTRFSEAAGRQEYGSVVGHTFPVSTLRGALRLEHENGKYRLAEHTGEPGSSGKAWAYPFGTEWRSETEMDFLLEVARVGISAYIETSSLDESAQSNGFRRRMALAAK